LVRKRGQGDIWKDLHEFFLVEKDEPAEDRFLKSCEFWSKQKLFAAKHIQHLSDQLIHQLTHQKIHSRILHVKVDKKINIEGYQWMSRSELNKIAFPRLITRYLENL
jgi:A/G-specific adenine glycosylase